MLCTGGAGQLYRESTNPSVATADGHAMAYRAGAELRDMEFMQFHPTVLYMAGSSRSLISEATRRSVTQEVNLRPLPKPVKLNGIPDPLQIYELLDSRQLATA